MPVINAIKKPIPVQIRTKIMNLPSWLSAEFVHSLSEWAGVGAALVTAIFLFTAVWSGNLLNTRQAEEIRRQDKELENERQTRLEMEKSLSPRFIPTITTNGETNSDPLKLFAGVNVEIVALPDAEPRRLGGNLGYILKRAGWNIINLTTDSTLMVEGVKIEAADVWHHRDLGTDAAKALSAFLVVNNIVATDFPPRPVATVAPLNSLKIIIGIKPDPYFDEKLQREAAKRSLDERNFKELEKSLGMSRQMGAENAQRTMDELWQRWREEKAKAPEK